MPEVQRVDNLFPKFFIGDNYTETATISVPANGEIVEGDMLQKVGGKFTPYTDSVTGDVVLAIANETMTNSTGAIVDVAGSVCIAGVVNKKLITVEGEAATEVQVDLLRKYGFVPQTVHVIDQLDN